MVRESVTGAELFVDALDDYGVTHVFGNPGTTELPVVNALDQSEMEYILAAHEDIAVGMAAGYASLRRYHDDQSEPNVMPVGVVNLHVAPGLAHGLGNLYGASMTGAPLVVTAGNHSNDFRHEEPSLSGDLVDLADQFTKWSAEVLDVGALPTMLRRAFRVALTPPTGPVFLGLPLDVMLEETDAEPEPLGEIPNAGRGDPAAIAHAADLLLEAEDPALVVGDGIARSGTDAVQAAVDLAEATGARVFGEILACEVDFPADHSQWVTHMPTTADAASEFMDVDTLVFAGISTNTTLTRHEEPLVSPDTTCIHLGDDAWEIGKNQPANAAILGDPGLVMADLAERVRKRIPADERAARLERVEELMSDVESRAAKMGRGDSDDPRASKRDLALALRNTLDDAVVVDESISAKYVLLANWDPQPTQFLGNKGGGLGFGLPAAVGAAIAEDEAAGEPGEAGGRDVLGYIGDGSYLYYPHTLYSAARHDVDLTVVVPDNRNYRVLKDNTLALLGGEEEDYDFTPMEFEPPVDIPANAESHGATGRRVEDPDKIENAILDAFDTEAPVVLDVLVQD